jgi:hypothetical protein
MSFRNLKHNKTCVWRARNEREQEERDGEMVVGVWNVNRLCCVVYCEVKIDGKKGVVLFL